jgi:hypothetical protein
MKLQNLSVRAFLRKIVAGTLLTAALLLLIFFLLTKDVRVVICGIILTAAFYIWGMVFLHYFQKKLSLFTDGLCQTLDHMMDSTDRPQVDYEAETLLSRISHRLERLYNVMQKTRHTAEGEKEELQSLVSDISQSRTLTWMLPPAEVYFTALSRMLNNASEVQRLSWDIVKSDGQSTDRLISFCSIGAKTPLMALTSVSPITASCFSSVMTPVSRREVFTIP